MADINFGFGCLPKACDFAPKKKKKKKLFCTFIISICMCRVLLQQDNRRFTSRHFTIVTFLQSDI